MAIKKPLGQTFTIGAGGLGDDTYVIGDADQGLVGTFAIQIYERVAGTCSFTVQARSRLISTTATTPPFMAIPYLPLHLNGSAGTYGTGSSAAITTDSLVLVPATGAEIALLVDYTDGEFDVFVTKLDGAAA
jgi:hypothetical protein